MDKRVRSPNYPSLSLPEALEKVKLVYDRQHTHGAPREVVVKSMGYNGINGASATAISALHKYGLLEGRGDEVRVSDRAMRYLNPMSAEERAEAIRDAAYEPTLFRELSEKFPGRLPNEDVLRSYLIRNGFSPSAVSGLILSYRQTIELVEGSGGAYDSASPVAETGSPMQPQHQSQPVAAPLSFNMKAVEPIGEERPLARYDFEGGAYIRVVVSGDIETEYAISSLEKLLAMKREEIEQRKRHSPPPIVNAEFEPTKE